MFSGMATLALPQGDQKPQMHSHSPLHFSSKATIIGYDYIFKKLFYAISFIIALREKAIGVVFLNVSHKPNKFCGTYCVLNTYLFNEKVTLPLVSSQLTHQT